MTERQMKEREISIPIFVLLCSAAFTPQRFELSVREILWFEVATVRLALSERSFLNCLSTRVEVRSWYTVNLLRPTNGESSFNGLTMRKDATKFEEKFRYTCTACYGILRSQWLDKSV